MYEAKGLHAGNRTAHVSDQIRREAEGMKPCPSWGTGMRYSSTEYTSESLGYHDTGGCSFRHEHSSFLALDLGTPKGTPNPMLQMRWKTAR